MMMSKQTFAWCVTLFVVVLSTVTMGQDIKEQDLIAVLQSDAAKGEKAVTCKKLAIYGSEKCVPMVADLLGDKELSSWARIALEAIPGDAPDAALRDALDRLDGRLLVGVINSIAVRKDGLAVDALIKKLADRNTAMASAAGVALGHLGGDKAAKALTKTLGNAPAEVRSAAAQGCVLCAEGYLSAGQSAQAVALYDKVRQADVPDQRHLEAIRGAILARRSEGLPLLLEQLRSQDKKRLGIGLRTARELPGRNVTVALADEMAQLKPDRQPLLLLALADRDDSAVLPTVLKAVSSPSQAMRVTAVNILIRIGDVSCVPALLTAATGEEDELQKVAVEALIRLPDDLVDADVTGRLPKSTGQTRQVLIEVAGQRQIEACLSTVVSCLKESDVVTRKAAVKTVGIIGQTEQAGDLVRLLQTGAVAQERAGIRAALLSICGRGGRACLPYLRPLVKSADPEIHIMGLYAMASIGGPESLGAVKSAIGTAAPQVKEEAVRVLSTWPNKWPDDNDAGQALLKLAGSGEKMSHQVLGLRGYLQYLRGSKAMNNDQKVAKVKAVLVHTKRAEEKRQAIAVLGESPCVTGLDLLKTLADDPALTEEAYSAMVVVTSRDVRGISKNLRRQVLKTVLDKTKNGSTRRRAQRTLGSIK